MFSTGEPTQHFVVTTVGGFRPGYAWVRSGVVSCGPLAKAITGSGSTVAVGAPERQKRLDHPARDDPLADELINRCRYFLAAGDRLQTGPPRPSLQGDRGQGFDTDSAREVLRRGIAQAFVWCGRSAVRPRPERPLDGAPEFAGGPGQIALHGLRNVGGTLGTAVSHGCVRLDTGAMRWLAARITPGVPVTITR